MASIVMVAIEVTLLLHHGPISFERSERWKAFLLFLPFVIMMAAIGVGFWRSAERADSGGKRIYIRTIAAFYTSTIIFVLAAIGWFIFFH